MKKIILFLFAVVLLMPAARAEVIGREVSYSANGVSLKGYLAYDNSNEKPRPGVLVVHEWWGHNDYARMRADMLAAEGYVAFAVDMYGEGKTAEHPKEAGKFAGEIRANMDVAKDRFKAALQVLRDYPLTEKDQIAAIGYCFGGGIVLEMARRGMDLDGVVVFHGSLATKNPAKKGEVKASVLVLHGADDSFTSPEDIQAFKDEMDSAGVDYKFIAYDGAVHSFTNPDSDKLAEEFGLPIAYNAEADKKSWQAMLEFFGRIFG